MASKYTRKFSLSMPDEMIRRINQAAKALYITKSDYVRQAVARALQTDEGPAKPESQETSPPEEKDETNGLTAEEMELLKKYGFV